MKATAIALIIASAIIGILAILGILSTNEYRNRITELEEINAAFSTVIKQKDFAYTSASMEIDNLEQVIQSKDTLIVELQVQVDMLPLYKETLRYYNSYIRLCQTTMIYNGIDYPKFVYDTILEDGYFEDLEDQVEWFDYVENGE